MNTTLYLIKYMESKVEYSGYFPWGDQRYAIEVKLVLSMSAFGDAPIPQELDVEVGYERPS